jgi:hypothetical protein
MRNYGKKPYSSKQLCDTFSGAREHGKQISRNQLEYFLFISSRMLLFFSGEQSSILSHFFEYICPHKKKPSGEIHIALRL